MQTSLKHHLNLLFLTALVLSALLAFQLLGFLSGANSPPISMAAKEKTPDVNLGSLPAYFIPNEGQMDPQVEFYSKGSGIDVYMTKKGLVYSFSRPADSETKRKALSIELSFSGANKNPGLVGTAKQEGQVNYLTGKDQSQWITDLPTYGAVTYTNLYPGIDAVYRGTGNKIKYEFVVAPGADPSLIQMAYSRGDLSVNGAGNLIIGTPWGNLKDEKPVAYQMVAGKRVPVEAGFAVAGRTAAFTLAKHNTSLPLIIDPGLDYSTFVGGSGSEAGRDLTLGPDGSAYVTGYTNSADFPVVGGSFDTTHGGPTSVNPEPPPTIFNGDDAFIFKLNPAGSGLDYATFVGGRTRDVGTKIVLGPDSSAYVVGSTDSTDFPTTLGAFDTTYNGGLTYGLDQGDVFVLKLNAAGNGLDYSTYVGGSDADGGGFGDNGIALGPNGDVFFTGQTNSADFPTVPGSYDTTYGGGGGDAFVASLNASGTALGFSTFIGDSGRDMGRDLALGSDSSIHVIGNTNSSSFPTSAGALDTSFNGSDDAFVARLNSSGTSLTNSTFLGGTGYESGRGIDLGPDGGIYVTGYTESTDYPVSPGAWDSTLGGSGDIFASRLNPAGTALNYSTYIGGDGFDTARETVVAPDSGAYVIGNAGAADFPVTPDAFDSTYASDEGVLLRLDPGGTALYYSTFIGGTGQDLSYSLALAPNGNVLMTGYTGSADFPITSGSFETTQSGGNDVYVSNLDPPPVTSFAAIPSPNGGNGWHVTPPTLRLTPDESAAVYYQWDSTSTGGWQGDSFFDVFFDITLTDEGEHTLHYFSVDSGGNTETVRNNIVKLDKTKPTASVKINNGALGTNSSNVTLNISAQDSVSGLYWMRVRNKGGAWSSWENFKTSKAWVLPEASIAATGGTDGTKEVELEVKDKAYNHSAIVSDTIKLDTQKPTASMVTPFISTKISKTTTFKVKWNITDPSPSSGIASVRVYYRPSGSPKWRLWKTATTSGQANFTGRAGKTYYFRTLAVDNARNWDWSKTYKTIVPFNEGIFASKIGFFGYQKLGKSQNYLSSVRYSYASGHSVTYKLYNTDGVGLITTRGPNRGRAKIYLDGNLITTVDAYKSSTRHRQLVFYRGFSKKSTHYLKVVNMGTPGRSRFDIDGVVVGR